MSALFEAFGVDWHLLFAQTVNFAILAAVLTYFLYKPVLKMVSDRQELVAKGVDDAAAAALALQNADASAKAKTSAAEVEAVGIVDRARQSAGDEKTRLLSEAQAQAAKVADDAALRAKETAAKALRDSEQEIARLAILAAGKVLVENK